MDTSQKSPKSNGASSYEIKAKNTKYLIVSYVLSPCSGSQLRDIPLSIAPFINWNLNPWAGHYSTCPQWAPYRGGRCATESSTLLSPGLCGLQADRGLWTPGSLAARALGDLWLEGTDRAIRCLRYIWRPASKCQTKPQSCVRVVSMHTGVV